MGSYLSKPVTTAHSQDLENHRLECGASSMQGWRESQEDAHNCILDFDKDVSLFAVYDGHGGAEVAQYASENLPALVKNDLYKDGEYKEALIKAYLEFDDSLITAPVVEKLTALRKANNGTDSEGEDNEKEEELNELYQEANMPIEEILLKYKNKIIKKSLENNDIEESGEDLPGSSKESEKEKSSSSSTTVVDILTKTNGTDENKSEILESSSITNVNGTSNDDEQFDTQEIGAESSKIECGPSSSNGQNGSGQRSGTACLITDDSDDTDDDDEIFEVPIEGSNSESDDDGDDDDDDDDDGDDDDDDDDSILIGADDEDEAGKDSGCTAVMALLVKNKLYVANAGDSRCVVSINGKAHDMSEDHKPEDEPELSRITAAGGRVSSDGRVNGGLNLSRALGDHNYKKNNDLPNTEQMITALPDVKVIDFTSTSSNSFLVLACDGIWNSLSSQDVVDFISEHINKPDIKLSSICEELFRTCLAPNTLSDGTGCDNMTCIIVKLKPQLKRPHYDVEEDDMSDGAEPKKPKSDST